MNDPASAPAEYPPAVSRDGFAVASPLFAVAPMMDLTDRHCRTLHRMLAPHAWLFTEMIHANALAQGSRHDLLRHGAFPHPVACQLGGSDPATLARASAAVARAGYDEVNLNVGCPSERVQEGAFGACLMARPERVADCVRAMKEACDLPVSVKCRLGIDELDSQPLLIAFVATIVEAGCDRLYVHARKAVLSGLSPAQNRSVPPLRPDRVWDLKRVFPRLPIVINGGIGSVAGARAHLEHVDGVMIGRAAYQNPLLLHDLEQGLHGGAPAIETAIGRWLDYIERELASGAQLAGMTRHMLGLFAGVPGARAFRRALSDHRTLRTNHVGVVRDALCRVAARAA